MVRGGRQVHEARAPLGRIESQEPHLAQRLPVLAHSAEQEGEVASRNLAAEILNNGELPPFQYWSLGQLVDLGSTSSPINILGVKFSGMLGEAV